MCKIIQHKTLLSCGIPVSLLSTPQSRLAGLEPLCRAEGQDGQPELVHGVEGDGHGGPAGGELAELCPHLQGYQENRRLRKEAIFLSRNLEEESGAGEEDQDGFHAAATFCWINHGIA